MENRHTSEQLILCEDCEWTGKLKECIHTYKGIPLTEDVEAIDECPKCNSTNLDGDLVSV